MYRSRPIEGGPARSGPASRPGAIIGLILGALVLGAAGPSGAAPDRAPSGTGDRTRVAAAFYPLAYAASEVGGKYVKVQNLTPPGVEPHDLELTTDQVDALQDAGLVVVLGRGFQPAVEKIARDRDRGTLEVLDALNVPERGAGTDPHIWLDPGRMREIVAEVQAALTEADPARARAFAANAARLDERLAALDTDYRRGLAACARNLIVTAHDAFGALARAYGLRQEGIAGLSPDAEPSARRLAELSDLVVAKGITTVFTETLVSPRVAKTLAREAGGLRTAVLNPLEGLTEREVDRGDDYVSVMRANLRALGRGLGCEAA